MLLCCVAAGVSWSAGNWARSSEMTSPGGLLPSCRGRLATELFSKRAKKLLFRVRLLEDVRDVGVKDEVLFVSPQQFMNTMEQQHRAIRLPLDRANYDLEAKEAKEKRLLSLANEQAAKILSLKEISMRHKAGASGQLFGSITKRAILDALQQYVGGKQPIIVSIRDASSPDTKAAHVGEIRHAGDFVAMLKVHSNVEPVSILIRVAGEN